MSIYLVLTLLISLSALFAYINQKFIKLPFVIGLFFLSTILSIAIISSHFLFGFDVSAVEIFFENARIDKIIIDILLGFLLFAGALHTDWEDIKGQIRPIANYAILGVLLSTILIAGATYYISGFLGIEINFIYCLLFGALISPTDPIAVLGILKKAGVPTKQNLSSLEKAYLTMELELLFLLRF
ncbi:MAG: sodium:proton antiporter [Chryseobacterium indoltheticum]|jgi:CPA1 family monovalent cation:H+ antiporter|nr:cation:proton antiporter [Chryseobacterium indoltheticum]MDF2834181.1 sodium:proton antiporter [Chryseobacterium indoltheticum]